MAHGDFTKTPCGTLEVIAPEALKTGCDHRVDVWGIGMICYMLLNLECMFKTKGQLHRAKWSVSNLDYSIESLKFISDTVRYDKEKRPFPNSVKDH